MSNNQKHYALTGKEWIEKLNRLNEVCPNTLKLQQYRFFCIYLAKINARDEGSRVVRFPVEEFQQIMELGRVNITHMKATTDNLLSQIVHIPRDDGGYDSFQLFKKCVVGKDNLERWYVEINAHDEALPLMFNLKEKYFKYRLENVLALKSINQIRLYELLKAKEHIGAELIIPLDLLKSQLGIGKKQYTRWENFKVRVIEPCRMAIENYTDICFTYEPIKRRNTVIGIKFNVYIKPIFDEDTESFKPDNVYTDPAMEHYASALGNEFNEETVRLIVNFTAEKITGKHDIYYHGDYGETERVYQCLADNYQRMCAKRANNPIDHPAAYIKKLITLDLDGEFDRDDC
jgi:plasmid replication initiation protein